MDNDILIVSEKDQKAYLPYKYSDLEKFYSENKDKYSSVEDVINKEYILDLNRFKHSISARFRETINLVYNKEHKSFFKAINLAFELSFKYNLNPIIISACRNLEELDIYLDCLDENELFDFRCFKIKFEVTPKIYKREIKPSFT